MTIDDATIAQLDNPRDLVGQRLTFSASHDKLGLESAAVVVLRECRAATTVELRDGAVPRCVASELSNQSGIPRRDSYGTTEKLHHIDSGANPPTRPGGRP